MSLVESEASMQRTAEYPWEVTLLALHVERCQHPSEARLRRHDSVLSPAEASDLLEEPERLIPADSPGRVAWLEPHGYRP